MARSKYEPLDGPGCVGWTWRDDRCMESLPWLLVCPLVNATGGDWMLYTSFGSHDVMGTHCFSGPWQCVSTLCPCSADVCKFCSLGSSVFLPQQSCSSGSDGM